MAQEEGTGVVSRDADAEGVIDARLAALTARFGERLTDEEWHGVRERIARIVDQGKALRAVPLTNADEPEIVFVPYRGGEA
ncbi:MAG TPA: hypothetical protein VFL82_12560 [Thermomicrobiales bacterium]|nr:hypothetical protein [Thermomicrobiales bacterium]